MFHVPGTRSVNVNNNNGHFTWNLNLENSSLPTQERPEIVMRVSIPLLLWVRWNRRTHCFDVIAKKVLHGRQIVKFLFRQFALSPWDYLMPPGNGDGRMCEFAKRTKRILLQYDS